jgi:transposase InsO family protein
VLFTAIDRYTKLAYARMYTTKSTVNAEDFLLRLHYLLGGQMEQVGHDNGSEFQGHFKATCEKLGIPQYHSRVKTPKDNATNERFNRTLREEFVEAGNAYDDPAVFNRWLTDWLVEYNAHRPHQSLGYVTPMSFIQAHAKVTPRWSSTTTH